MSFTPVVAPARVCAGLDLTGPRTTTTRFAYLDGSVLDRFFVVRVDEVGIERGDRPVVHALLQAELTVLVIATRRGQEPALALRFGRQQGEDRFDAYLPAGVVRTDRAWLRLLARDSAATTALRTTVRARRDLVQHQVPAANLLCAHLQLLFPGAAGLFAAIDSAISFAFPERFTTQAEADWLSVKRSSCARCPTAAAPAPRSCTPDFWLHLA